MNKKSFSLILALACLAPAASSAVPLRTVSVTGAGQVQVKPNVATLSLIFVDKTGASQTVADIVQQNNVRVVPALEYIKSVVGSQGAVTASPSIQPVYEYNQTTGQQVATGHSIVTTIQVILRGEAALEQKLGKLFDAAENKADSITSPSLGVSEARLAAAKRRAYRKAMLDAQNEAASQLLPGEKLGAALSRGSAAPSYSSSRARGGARPAAMAMAMESADAGGQATVETGKVTVQTVTNVVFSVTGRAKK